LNDDAFLLQRMSPELAHRDVSRQRSTLVAFGAKQTLFGTDAEWIRSD
jgi:hypothetical protein